MNLMNLITTDYADHLESVLLGEDFAWFYHAQTTNNEALMTRTDHNTMETPFFTHIFYRYKVNSSQFKLVLPIIRGLETQLGRSFQDRLIRIKANLVCCQPNYPNGAYHTPHIDDDSRHEVLIYYVNDSDGDTLLFERDSIRRTIPEKGKALLFDGKTFHAGTPPRQHPNRVIINFVFRKDTNGTTIIYNR